MDNSYGKGVGDTDPTTKPGVKGGVPMRAAPPHKHKPQKEAHSVGAYPAAPATSDCTGPGMGLNAPALNG